MVSEKLGAKSADWPSALLADLVDKVALEGQRTTDVTGCNLVICHLTQAAFCDLDTDMFGWTIGGHCSAGAAR